MTPLVIGTITPSSNRAVERTLAGMLPHLPGVESCVARITFHGAGLGQPMDGYELEEYRRAAWQLSHAGIRALCWNGTRGAALGLEKDRALVAAMEAAAGCRATTAALSTAALLDRLGVRRVGLLTQGDAAQAAASAAGLGRELAGFRALGMTDNAAPAALPPARIAELLREIAQEARPEALLVWSTNLAGWEVMAPLEAEIGIPVIDSAAAGVWGVLDAAGADLSGLAALGRIFRP